MLKITNKTLHVFLFLLSSFTVFGQVNENKLILEEKIDRLFAFEIERKDLDENFKRIIKDAGTGPGILIIPSDLSEEDYKKISKFANSFSQRPILALNPKSNIWPSQLSIGAITKREALSNWALKIGEEIKNSGFDMVWAPFPGLSNFNESHAMLRNSINEDWELTGEKVKDIQNSLNTSNIKCAALDFPGFRNNTDQEYLNINLDADRIKNIEMQPYKNLIDNDVKFVQMSQASVRLNEEESKPFFLSQEWTKDLLRNDLKYKGLIISADLEKTAKWYSLKSGQIELQAFESGCEILLNAENSQAAKKKLRSLIKKDQQISEELDKAIRKIDEIRFKGRVNLSPVKVPKIEFERLLEASITTIQDNRDIIPVKNLENRQIACIHIGTEYPNMLSSYLDKYDRIKHFSIRDRFNYYQKFEEIKKAIKDYDLIFIPIGEVSFDDVNTYGIGELIPRFISEISQEKDVVIFASGNPEVLDLLSKKISVILSYELNDQIDRLMPQIAFGAKVSTGVLPFATKDFAWNSGIKTKSLSRLDYVYPEEVGMNTSILSKIDEVVEEALITHATPGCQVLVAKDGHIVLEKAYGYLSYDSVTPVDNNTVYDIASITKVAATLQAVMLLSEMDVIDVNQTASKYLVDLRNTDKDGLFISEILSHQSGLTPYIPYWRQTVDSEGLDDRYYCDNPDDWFCVEVIPGIYTIRSMEDSLWEWTIDSELSNANKDGTYSYKYSDLGFYIMKKLVERQSRQPIEDFLKQNFYDPIGMSRMTFFPLGYYRPEEIAPTEQDDYFRNTLIRGTVHDQGAAMFGGVGGHAGLFSNALDLAKLMQMNLNKGSYGGQRYFYPQTIETFTERHFVGNRRGLGWDKPLRSGNGPSSDLCSYNTFGHTGFTGTSVWADPDYGLVFVFLSNRIHPDVNNKKLIKQNIRTRIQDIVYESIFINDLNKKD